jgi:hypothetical protein
MSSTVGVTLRESRCYCDQHMSSRTFWVAVSRGGDVTLRDVSGMHEFMEKRQLFSEKNLVWRVGASETPKKKKFMFIFIHSKCLGSTFKRCYYVSQKTAVAGNRTQVITAQPAAAPQRDILTTKLRPRLRRVCSRLHCSGNMYIINSNMHNCTSCIPPLCLPQAR